jgi:toxin ParE1/3/4
VSVNSIRITEAAALSILDQADYYEHKSGLSLALRWEASVKKALRSLLKLPLRGAPCRFHAPALDGLRWISVPGFRKHLVFYRYDPAGRAILIVQVLHGGRDLKSLLGNDDNAS